MLEREREREKAKDNPGRHQQDIGKANGAEEIGLGEAKRAKGTGESENKKEGTKKDREKKKKERIDATYPCWVPGRSGCRCCPPCTPEIPEKESVSRWL